MQRGDNDYGGRVEEALLYLEEAEAIEVCDHCLDICLDRMDADAVEDAVEQMSEAYDRTSAKQYIDEALSRIPMECGHCEKNAMS